MTGRDAPFKDMPLPQSTPMAAPGYRPELDGLRALAVWAVVIYHVRLPFMQGGFLGVDVFFVLSGYLIIGLLSREHEAGGRVQWMAFYARRFRRLLPVFAVVLPATLLASVWVHFPFGDQQWVGRAGVFAAFSLSNLMLWSTQAAYFDAATEQLPLLHTWSLSVEEQFYLLVPLLLGGATVLSRQGGWPWRTTLRRLAYVLAMISLATAAWQSRFAPLAAYYLPPARMFEFLLGGLVAWGMHPTVPAAWRARLAALAVAGLITAMCLASRGSGSLGWTAFAAVTTAVVLWAMAGTEPMAMRRLLALPPMVWVGQRSYGWYLWHFPAIVLWRAYWLEDTTPLGDLLVCFASLLLAHLTYTFVEQPGRRAPALTAWKPVRLIALALAVLALLAALSGGLALWAKYVIRPSSAMQALEAQIADRGGAAAPCLDFGQGSLDVLPPACRRGGDGVSAQVYLWGDSHAAHYQAALFGLLSALPVQITQLTHAGCPPLLDFAGFISDPVRLARCQLFQEKSLARIFASASHQPTVVVMSTYWISYLMQPTVNANLRNTRALNHGLPTEAAARDQLEASLARTLAALSARGVRIIVVGPPPEPRVHVPYCLHRFGELACRTRRAEIESHHRTTLASLHRVVDAVSGAQLINPVEALCTDDWCPGSRDGRVLYFDANHLSAAGAGLLRPQFSEALRRSLR